MAYQCHRSSAQESANPPRESEKYSRKSMQMSGERESTCKFQPKV